MAEEYEIAIIGGGAAGIMAALRGVLNNNKVVLFTGNGKTKKKSRAQWVARVDNMPGFHHYKKGILEPNLETIQFIESCEFSMNFTKINKTATQITKKDDLFIITDDKDNSYQAQFVVLATGVMDVQPLIQGSIDPILPYANMQLVDYCIRCDGHHVHGKNTSVIGHTDSAAWVAIMLRERYNVPQLNILTNGEDLQVSDEVKAILELYDTQIYTSPIQSIQGNAKESVLTSFTLEDGAIVKNEATFVALGMIIYNELAKALHCELDQRGFVITNEKSETSTQNVYAIGDLQAGKKNQIYTGWDTAVDALDHIDTKIRTNKRKKLLASKGA